MKHKLRSVFLSSVSKSGFASRTLFRCDSLMVRGGRPTVGDCDSEVVLEEEGWGCDDCASGSSLLGGETRSFDGRRDVMRGKSWDRHSATQREK